MPMMCKARVFAVFLTLLLGLVPTASFSRPWQPTPTAMAMDYSQVTDNRGGKELVFVWWLNSPSFSTLPPSAIELLDKYVVIGAVHAHVSTGALFSFDDIPSLDAKSGSASLKSLSGDAIPPTVAGLLTTLEASLGQALGPTGKGIHWFVYDAGPLKACDKGDLTVPLADQTYSWDTPIPGCPKK
jgi:hypothetical protein